MRMCEMSSVIAMITEVTENDACAINPFVVAEVVG